MGRPVIDLTGQRFGRLIVVSIGDPIKSGQRRWNCVCDCGGTATACGLNLRQGRTTSCGCQRVIAQRETKTTHGASGTPEYNTWNGMIQRCTNPDNGAWKNYGGRGIKVCDEWRNDFDAFLAHIGPKPHPSLSVDRINNNGNYEPGNVRWATAKEQANNTRRSKRYAA